MTTTFIPYGGPPTILPPAFTGVLSKEVKPTPLLASREAKNLLKQSLHMQIQLAALGKTEAVYGKVYEAKFGSRRNVEGKVGENKQRTSLSVGSKSAVPSGAAPMFSKNKKCEYKRWSDETGTKLSEASARLTDIRDQQSVQPSQKKQEEPLGPVTFMSATADINESDIQAQLDDLSLRDTPVRLVSPQAVIASNVDIIREEGGLLREITQIKERHKNLEELTKLKQKEALIQKGFLEDGATGQKPQTAPSQLQGSSRPILGKVSPWLMSLIAEEKHRDLVKEKTKAKMNREFTPAASTTLHGGLAWTVNADDVNKSREERTSSAINDNKTKGKWPPGHHISRPIHPATDARKGKRTRFPQPTRTGDITPYCLPRDVTQTSIPIEAAQRLHAHLRVHPLRPTPIQAPTRAAPTRINRPRAGKGRANTNLEVAGFSVML